VPRSSTFPRFRPIRIHVTPGWLEGKGADVWVCWIRTESRKLLPYCLRPGCGKRRDDAGRGDTEAPRQSAIPKLIEALGKVRTPHTVVASLTTLVQNATLPSLGMV